MPYKRPTIRDVAKKTGLSVSTISLVLNEHESVSDKTRRNVKQAITDLKYHPRRSARGLASRTSGNIGFILTEDHFLQAEPFYSKVFLGTEFEARRHEYYVLLTTVSKGRVDLRQTPRFLLEHNVDGIIIAGKISHGWIDECLRRDLPVVLIDFEEPVRRISTVVIDNRGGARMAAEHLLNLGHTRIGFLAGDLKHPSIAERAAGFKEALRTHGIDARPEWMITDQRETGIENGAAAARQLFARPGDRPTAIFAANDAMAIGCLQALKDLKMAVPKDVALVGFDDIETGLHVEPRLSTVHVNKEELGAIAVRRLVELMTAGSPSLTRTAASVDLVVRESSGGLMGSVASKSA
ncbi:MAG: LacI family DNA-binding transcriptional regulator [Bacteroidota bacterium]